MGMSSVPLSELYAGAAQFLKAHGARRPSQHQRSNPPTGTNKLRSGLSTRAPAPLVSEFLVIALPFEALQKLLPHLPAARAAEAVARKIERFEHWPICSVHLWFDRQITDSHHAVLLDREIHWMYNKTVLQPWRQQNGSYLELVQSASRRFAALERAASHRSGAKRTRRILSGGKEAKLEKAALIKEVRATFGVPPGIDSLTATFRISLAQLLPRWRLDRHRLALHDGECRPLRPPRRRRPLHRKIPDTPLPRTRPQAPRSDEILLVRSLDLDLDTAANG